MERYAGPQIDVLDRFLVLDDVCHIQYSLLCRIDSLLLEDLILYVTDSVFPVDVDVNNVARIHLHFYQH